MAKDANVTLDENQLTVQLILTVQFNTNGLPRETIMDHLLSFVQQSADAGCLSGNTEATVEHHAVEIAATDCELDEDMLSEFMLHRIQSGDIALEDLPSKLVAYGLMNPIAFTQEMAERMKLRSEPTAEPQAAAVQEPCPGAPSVATCHVQRAQHVNTVARAAGQALEAVFPFGYSSSDTEP